MTHRLRVGAIAALTACAVAGATSPRAQALNPLRSACGAAGAVSGAVGRACVLAAKAGRVLRAGKRIASRRVGGALSAVVGGTSSSVVTTVAGAAGLAALVIWVEGGAQTALRETARVLASSTTPQLAAPWFSSIYWRVAGISLVLTLPFLFAAAIQAILRADLALLARAAFGYLPLATLGLALAAQLTALLLGVTDGLSALLADAAGGGPGSLLSHAAVAVGTGAVAESPFVAVFVAVFTVAGALTLWLEMFMREAAVYVVVLLLPFAFSALVWPARRVWAVRAAELLVALILSKLVIIAVLTLGAAAFAHSATVSGMLTGLVLLLLGAFAPWAMVRLVPFADLADGAVSRLRRESPLPRSSGGLALAAAGGAEDWAHIATARMRSEAERVTGDGGRSPDARRPDEMASSGDVASALFGMTAEGDGPDVGARSAGTGRPRAAEETGAVPEARDLDVAAEADSSEGEPGRPEHGETSGEATAGWPRRERMPGMPPRWQMPDGSWKPLYFDLDHFPPELWVDPNSEGPQSPGEVPPGTRSPRDVPHGPRPAGDPPPDAPTPRERSEANSDAAASDE